MKNIKKILLITVITTSVLYLLLCCFVYLNQTNLIFFPKKGSPKSGLPANVLDVYITTKDNIKLHAWYLENHSATTVIFFHGNGGNLSSNAARLNLFNDLRVNALMIDYRGYGLSSGEIKRESDLSADAESAYQYVLQNNTQEKNIVIWGQSLGGSVATDLAQQKNIKALIIESSFNSMDDIGRLNYGFLPISIISKFHFRSDFKLKNVTAPVVVMHSKADDVIPFSQGQKLFNNALGEKYFYEIQGTHNGGFLKSYEIYKKVWNDVILKQPNNL